MDQVQKVLQNPAVKAGLRVASPQVAIFVEMIVPAVSFIFNKRRKPKIDTLLNVIDEQLAETIDELSSTDSRVLRRQLEIKAHTLLEILVKWNDKN